MTDPRTTSGLRQDALACVEAAIAAVEPERLVVECLRRRPLPDAPVRLVAIGKAAVAMASGARQALGRWVRGGVVVAPPGAEVDVGPGPDFEVFRGGHPAPNQGSVRGGRAVHRLAIGMGSNELLLCLLSGGGSALMSLPPDGVSLDDLRRVTDLLMTAGAPIDDLNTVRKHLDDLKGGRLARAAMPARVLALVLSDVVGDPLDVIASGPVTPNPTSFTDAISILERFDLWEKTPRAIRRHLEAGKRSDRPESPGPGDPCFERVETEIVGNNLVAAEAALAAATKRGYNTRLLSTELTGEAREVGARLGTIAREVKRGEGPVAPPACLVAAGETTVTVRGPGRGGPNQELALSLALELEGIDGALAASVGTDGIDGPTDAAGAIVTGETTARARALEQDAERALADNDTYPFFDALGDLVMTGPTGTNVMDIQVVLLAS